jgi:ELWxxDGT repeat protein
MRRRRSVNFRNTLGRFEKLEQRQLLTVDLGLILDLNQTPASISPGPTDFLDMGEYALFRAITNEHGDELWRTNGSAEGTYMLMEPEPGYKSSHVYYIGELGTRAVFAGFNANTGQELYITDGTQQGTRLLKDIVPGQGPFTHYPLGIASVGQNLLFWAEDSNSKLTLWSTDGTSDGTKNLAALEFGNTAAVVMNGMAYFGANDGTNGIELWRSDGTAAGTQMVADITSGPGSSQIGELAVLDGKLLFAANQSDGNTELWISDGTASGTQLLKDIVPGPTGANLGNFVAASQGMFFVADGGIWLSNGTSAGTQLVHPFANPSEYYLVAAIDDDLFYGRQVNGTLELWQSDGVLTSIVNDGGLSVTDEFTGRAAVVHGDLYFTAISATFGNEVWRLSNGQVSLVKDIAVGNQGSSPGHLSAFGNKLLFSADDGLTNNQLWITDGTAIGTRVVREIGKGTEDGASQFLFQANDQVYFTGSNGNGWSLFKTDGSPTGTQLVKNIVPWDFAFQLGTNYFFTAFDPSSGIELWRTDGTADGTVLVSDIVLGPDSSSPGEFVDLDNFVLFSAQGSSGKDLWKFDKTTQTVSLVRDINPSGSSFIDDLVRVNNSVIFTVTLPNTGSQLWITDGTPAGTSAIFEGPSDAIGAFAVLNNQLIFMADSPGFGQELWISDGTVVGTTLLKDIRTGALGSDPRGLTALGQKVYFTATDENNLEKLWSTDGTAAGTVPVNSSLPIDLRDRVVVGDSILAFGGNAETGRELVKFDGQSVSLVKDIRVGPATSAADGSLHYGFIRVIEGRTYFEANDGVHGTELWVSDGTSEGTYLVGDITGDSGGFYISDVQKLGHKILTIGFTDEYGNEIWIEQNLPPTQISIDAAAISENASVGTIVGTVSAVDPNPWDTVTLSLATGSGDTDNQFFELVENKLRTKSIFDHEQQSTRSIHIKATDSEGNILEKVFSIAIENQNETPTDLQVSSNQIDENKASGTAIGTFGTSDPDTGDNFTYSLINGDGDSDNDQFEIVGNQLLSRQSFNFEAKAGYSVRVQTRDAGGLTFEKSFEILVNDVNEVPTILEVSSNQIDENKASGTVIGTFGTSDPDTGDNFTYSLINGDGDSDNDQFEIVGDQLLSRQSFNFEAKAGYSVRVQTLDAGGLSFEKSFEILVNDVNEAPTMLEVSSNRIDENNASGTVIGTFSTGDPDAGDGFSYSLISGNGDSDNDQFEIVGDQLLSRQSFNFEAKSGYSLRVQTRDAGGLAFEVVILIVIEDINEAPSAILLSNDSIREALPSGSLVGNLHTVDQDVQDTHTYRLVAGQGDADNASFRIVNTELLSSASFDFESKSSFSIRIESQDGAGNVVQAAVTIAVLNFFAGEDTNHSGTISPTDALLVINFLNSLNDRVTTSENFLLDVNRDGLITPSDALRIINLLNSRVGGEGEFGLSDPLFNQATNRFLAADSFFAQFAAYGESKEPEHKRRKFNF